jgi:tight adherence protein C
MDLDPLMVVALGLVFAASAALVWGLGQWLAQRRLHRRLKVLGLDAQARARPRPHAPGAGAARTPRWESVLESLSRLSVPEGGWQTSALRLKFVRAGIRDAAAPRVYFAIKTVGTLLLPLLVGWLLWLALPGLPRPKLTLCVLLLAALGYYLPDLYVRLCTQRRTQDMRDVLPDLMDLLVICTESGMSMDAAINRVAQEIALSSRALAEEFYLAALEIRAGAGRCAALQNLALRVHLEDLYSMVTMLVQADRFGTGLAESLRIQSELMRHRRMQRAEEMAAKVPVKMLIPLVLFIFPALLIVLVGPAFIQIATLFRQ